MLAKRLPFDGVWIPSGWMGDAERPAPAGPLRYRVRSDTYHSAPTCEEWSYSPSSENSFQHWVAVAYQSPPSNWGAVPGKNLSGMHFNSMTFWAKAMAPSTIHLLVKSGGGTRPGSPYASSYLVEKAITLTDRWERFSLTISGFDHSSVPSALTFALTADRGQATFLIDDLAFEGP